MNRKILITGGAGFIGSHFVEGIIKDTLWDIVILDKLTYAGNYNRLADIELFNGKYYEKLFESDQAFRINILWHDFRSEPNDFIKKEIGEVDYILHLGAETHVDRSITDPEPFVMTNVIGTMRMLEYAKTLPNLKKFIYFSTDEVFGPTIGKENFKEDARHAPGNPYAATKAGAEDLCLSYANTYGMPIMITNTMNVFGERQHPEKFIPMTIKKVLNGEMNTIHADPTLLKAGSRFYLHARNAWNAIHFILENTNEFLEVKDSTKGRFNIVGEKEVDNLELAQFIAKVIREPLKYEMVNFHQSRPGHDLRYGLDGTKLKNMGFQFPKTFEESLTKTIEWSLKNKNWIQ